MTASQTTLAPFHVGLVVNDVQAVAESYAGLLGVPAWARYDVAFPAAPWDPRTTDSRLRIMLGKAGGMTFELIQPVEGVSLQSLYLDKHGDGIHHLGFWVTDLQQAVTEAVSGGAAIEWAVLQPDGAATVQLRPGATSRDVLPALLPDRMAYLNPGPGGALFEFCGRAHYPVMGDRIGGDPLPYLTPPPWLQELGWEG